MRVVSVVGARPQFVKLAPVHAELSRIATHLVVHTGQHYDNIMSAGFFEALEIPSPIVNLGAGSGSHAEQTGRIMRALEPELIAMRPDWVLVYGDTNSTIAAALTAVKLDLRVAHIEAGLRSRNRQMPEEHNRVLTDHASDLCLAPTSNAIENLRNEGLGARSRLVGDVMVDVLRQTISKLDIPENYSDRNISSSYLATIHRQENTDNLERLNSILTALNSLDKRVSLLAHPRLRARMGDFGLTPESFKHIAFMKPMTYFELIGALAFAPGLVTDSGGLQKEAFLLGVPCVTLRTETEWVETVNLGWNTLAEPEPEIIIAFLSSADRTVPEEAPYGVGDSGRRVAQALVDLS